MIKIKANKNLVFKKYSNKEFWVDKIYKNGDAVIDYIGLAEICLEKHEYIIIESNYYD